MALGKSDFCGLYRVRVTLVGKKCTISIQITHSYMACFLSTQITGEILGLVRGFLFYK